MVEESGLRVRMDFDTVLSSCELPAIAMPTVRKVKWECCHNYGPFWRAYLFGAHMIGSDRKRDRRFRQPTAC